MVFTFTVVPAMAETETDGTDAPTVPAAPTAVSVTFNSVKLTSGAGLEYSIDGINWQDSITFVGLEAETEYTFYQRVKASDVANVSEVSEGLTVTTVAAPDFVPGDVDGNGAVNASDLAVLKKVIAGLIDADDTSVVNPDVNGEGGSVANAADLALLKKMIAGLA